MATRGNNGRYWNPHRGDFAGKSCREKRPATDPKISRIWMHLNPKQKSGPIDNPGEKPKTLRETQSGRLYRVATRENKQRHGFASTDF
jgi:hypothetical protein